MLGLGCRRVLRVLALQLGHRGVGLGAGIGQSLGGGDSPRLGLILEALGCSFHFGAKSVGLLCVPLLLRSEGVRVRTLELCERCFVGPLCLGQVLCSLVAVMLQVGAGDSHLLDVLLAGSSHALLQS